MISTKNEAPMNPALLPLTPGELAPEDLAAYDEQFSMVFADPHLRNIAVSGAPGSGKSTVMNSWRRAHPDHGWLEISLANFASDDRKPTPNAIEDALINQIVGKMDLRRAPKTRFRKDLKRPWTTDLAHALIGAAFIALSIFLAWSFSLIPSSRPPLALIIIAAIAWFACIIYGIYKIGRTNALGRLAKRLHIDPGHIELSTEDGLPLQRYMSDLVYLFDTSTFDTVIFDDLDSFNYLPLFQQLRQMNDLANESRANDREPLRFFYLVNDGMFNNPHDRTKFFDYIITVIPYIDPSNALALFREGLEGVNIHASDEFLYELSLFIDDPRILRDLVNETHHYRSMLFADAPLQSGDTERLIALLAYKTLFPRDFELLQVDQGYVNALLRSRGLIIEQLTAQNSREAEALMKELRSGTVSDAAALQMRIDQIESENLQFSRLTLAQLLSSLEDAEIIFNDPPYVHGINAVYLSEILASPHFPLIQFLIMRGWIDDTHERFMSNFYSDSISVRDREYLMGIFQGKPAASDYQVENPNAVIGRLDADTLSWSNAKNFSLLTYLLHHGPEDKLRAIFTGIRHDHTPEWLLEYTESPQFDGAIFAQMEAQIPGAIIQILNDSTIDSTRRRRFAHRVLAYGGTVLENEALRDALRDFAVNDLAFLQVEATKPMAIAEGLRIIKYNPTDLYTDGVSRKLLHFIFTKGLFEPTAPFLDSLTSAIIDAAPALESGYLVTRLYDIDDDILHAIVEENADLFVSTLLENTERNLTESSEAIAWLLNCESLSEKMARAYIDAISEATHLEDVEAINNPTYQALLLDKGNVKATAENILDYFQAKGYTIDDHLGQFINSNPFPPELTMGFAEQHFNGDESGFLTALITSPILSNDKLKEIVSIYRAQFNHFNIEGLDDNRVHTLIDLGVIRPTADNLEFVREHNPEIARYFAEVDAQAYAKLVLPAEGEDQAPCPFEIEEAKEIFKLDDVDSNVKIELLKAIEGPLPMDSAYPDALNAAIASAHFDPHEDLEKISQLYIQGDRKLKRALSEAFVDQALDTTQDSVKLSMDMLADVAWRLRNERQEMLTFLASQLANREPEPTRFEVRALFERANLKEYIELIDGPSAVIPQTPADNMLLDTLASLNMAGKQAGKTDWQGQRRINSKGYSRK